MAYRAASKVFKAHLLLVMIVAAVAFILACGEDETPTGTSAPGVTATAQATATRTPTQAAKVELNRLVIAAAPTGYDTNLTWMQGRTSQIDKMPALEFLVGSNRNTGEYIPELAEKWETSPDGKSWTINLRQGIKFHEPAWGTFGAKDVRNAVFLLTQPESIQSSAGTWRGWMGIGAQETIESAGSKVSQKIEIVNDNQVAIHLGVVAPEFFDTISITQDLVMESKARWDSGGKDLYSKAVVGTEPFQFVERVVNQHVLYKRVDNHWRKTPEYKELQFRWMPEDLTRMAAILSGEAQIAGVPRSLQKDVQDKGMSVVRSKLPSVQLWINLGGQYYTSPELFDANAPFVKKEVRQAMSMAINRKEISDNLLQGRTDPLRVVGYHTQLDGVVWPGVYNSEWDGKFEGSYGYNPTKAKELLTQAGYPNGFEFTQYIYRNVQLPELKDISESISNQWKAIGLKPTIKEVEFAEVRDKYRKREMKGAAWAQSGGRILVIDYLKIYNKTANSVAHVYEDAYIDERLTRLDSVIDKSERSKLLKEIGEHKFAQFAEIPMYWLFTEVAVNPKVIGNYSFTGTVTGIYSHLEFIELAAK
ncbi:MAG: ABC transporter substrate-binding protein [SAR202 cluster bacterium]|nr:ABC transporter substrate-binding protein [SAR202 cluster bacterium]